MWFSYYVGILCVGRLCGSATMWVDYVEVYYVSQLLCVYTMCRYTMRVSYYVGIQCVGILYGSATMCVYYV